MAIETLIPIVIAIITTLGGGWTYLDRRKVARESAEKDERLANLERQKVEALAYEKARAHYDAIIDDLTTHITWLKSELASTTQENTRLKERIEALEKTIEALRAASVVVIQSPDPPGHK